uniref:Kallikrein related peptidase 8 n=1 Tax=Bos mutus grunniens TaxID=30521 RepID=A0A8C0AE48_BOSMU
MAFHECMCASVQQHVQARRQTPEEGVCVCILLNPLCFPAPNVSLLPPGHVRAQENKVLEGKECKPHSQPWQTALFQGVRLICGGVLIEDNWVLTAAHCQKKKYMVRMGEHSLKKKDESEQEGRGSVHPAPCYNNSKNNHSYDVMLIQLRGRVSLGPKVKPIKLADHCPQVGQKCTISGWGTVTSPREKFPDTLNCAEVKIIPQDQCEKAYPGQVTDSMVCAGDSSGADTCQVSAFGNSLFYLLIFGCAGSPWLCLGFLQLQRTGWGVWGGGGGGSSSLRCASLSLLSCCRVQALGA